MLCSTLNVKFGFNDITMEMEKMDRLRDAITDYIYDEGREYQRLLISRTYYSAMKKEAEENDVPIDLPNMEIKDNVDYDFKLLP